ncbi:hypothetical protein [Hoylesella loescheii]|uniref:hypothetical protein n=1 Tax=Hoylesella loescheii TaxID=840 RepID=UPI0026EBDAEC|nr:hypothetical protein [Hoylesella loescheii]
MGNKREISSKRRKEEGVKGGRSKEEKGEVISSKEERSKEEKGEVVRGNGERRKK